MKKTLIALMIATVSGSAIAESGTFTLSGIINIKESSPWEVIIGNGKSDLNVEMKSGDKMVVFKSAAPIPILGIRTKSESFFRGASSISPQIDFGGMLDLSDGEDGMAKLVIPVKRTVDGKKFATFVTALTMGAGMISYSKGQASSALQNELIASTLGDAFFGGLPVDDGNSLEEHTVFTRITGISAEYTKNFPHESYPKWDDEGFITSRFDDTGRQYQAFYGSGIEVNQDMGLLLDEPAKTSSSVPWVASLPITVSYM
ncbi:TPA: hypothetical protein J1460_004816 [Escherichia coli]|nr:hypothetical protein [Escherichia coli]